MKSVRNALRILEEVSSHQPIKVGDLSRIVGLPKTSVQRALITLGEAGWLRQENATAGWSLSARVFAISRGSALHTLRSVALQTMEKLRSDTGETILLFLRDGRNVVAIEGLDGLKPVRAHTSVGTAAPLHASASGKALLAEMTREEVESYIRVGLPAHTERTISDPRSLRAELDRIRKRGYATHRGEWLAGVAAVGAVIHGSDRLAQAAMVIAAPAERVSQRREQELGARVVGAAREISRSFS